jgi:uncharacterized membrane protein YeaQ/YmgE (transglycosylase-associated protein family)
VQTTGGALGAAVVALLATLVAQRLFKIKPPGGFVGGFLASYVSAALGRWVVPCPAWDGFSGFCLVPAVLAAAIPWFWFGRERAAPQAVICEGLVQLSLQNGAPLAKPYCVCLRLGRPLTWDVVAGPGDQVRIEFETKGTSKGPFIHDTNNPGNPHRGVYERVGSGELRSNAAESTGRWDYTVTWQSADGDARTIDPEVCIQR